MSARAWFYLLTLLMIAGCVPVRGAKAILPAVLPAVEQIASVSAAVAAGRSEVAPPASSEGEASWYGPGFAGRRTANGETFDPGQLTAAHRTLPFNSRVRVTHLQSGESVIVRINDRGPFTGGRIIDLSRAAAEQVGLLGSGIARVRLELLSGSGGVITAAPATHLTPYEIVANGRQLGELLLLSSAAQESGPVMVRVVGDAVPVDAGAELLLSEQLFAELGSDVLVNGE